MSAEDNLARLPPQALTHLNDRLKQAQRDGKRVPLGQRYIRLREIADEVGARIAPVTPCAKGCSHCCYMAADVTRHEAQIIARFTGRKIAKQEEEVLDTPAAVREAIERTRARWTRVACTFLAPDGSCSVYEVRPLACRLHHSLEDDADRCDSFRYPGGIVASANLTALLVVIGDQLGPRWADIREWFPPDDVPPMKKPR